jgi:hypothetical protein
MKREIQVHVDCGEGFNYDYDIIQEESFTELKRSDDKAWTNPGEPIISCTEDMMEGEYTIKIDKQRIKLDYSQALEMLSLLLFLEGGSKIKMLESKIIKQI